LTLYVGRNKMDDLLKEAIADAKAVRETALANAKMALEEAFTPKLKSMLSKKIQSEMDIDEEGDEAPEEEEEGGEEAAEEPESDFGTEEPAVEPEEGEMEEDGEEGEEPEDAMEAEGVIEINGIKYAPVVAEEDEEEAEEAPAEEEPAEEEGEMEEGEEEEYSDEPADGEAAEEDLDLEAILKELEDEINEEEAGQEGEDEVVDDLTDAGADSDSDLDSSDVGDAENKEPSPEASDSSDAGQGSEEPADGGEEAAGEEGEEEVVDDLQDENIDLEQILKALTEDDEEGDSEDAEALKNELEEHRKVVRYLRSKLNEVNLLNAKLLFTNKLFRAHSLSEEKKVKVIETFDRARTLREVKLVYATMAESFGGGAKRGIKESKGSASKAVASTKSKARKVISEAGDLKARFKKLANINS
jgi:hypothetical protein